MGKLNIMPGTNVAGLTLAEIFGHLEDPDDGIWLQVTVGPSKRVFNLVVGAGRDESQARRFAAIALTDLIAETCHIDKGSARILIAGAPLPCVNHVPPGSELHS